MDRDAGESSQTTQHLYPDEQNQKFHDAVWRMKNTRELSPIEADAAFERVLAKVKVLPMPKPRETPIPLEPVERALYE